MSSRAGSFGVFRLPGVPNTVSNLIHIMRISLLKKREVKKSHDTVPLNAGSSGAGVPGAVEEGAGGGLRHVRRARGPLRQPRRVVLCEYILSN